MKVYKAKTQTSEMNYQQPVYCIRKLDSDVLENDSSFIIATSKITSTYQVDDAEAKTSTHYSKFMARTMKQYNLKKWRKKYEKLGFQKCISDSTGGPALLSNSYEPAEDNVLETFLVLEFSCNTHIQVAQAANYFQDRLPARFYERYKDVLIVEEIPVKLSHEEIELLVACVHDSKFLLRNDIVTCPDPEAYPVQLAEMEAKMVSMTNLIAKLEAVS